MRTLKEITEAIVQSYRTGGGANHLGGLHLPSRDRVARILQGLEELVFPGFSCDELITDDNLEYVTGSRVASLLDEVWNQVILDLAHEKGQPKAAVVDEAHTFAIALFEQIPALRASLNLDVQALLEGDPAVRSREEVILAYPGLRAVLVHRVANFFWKNDVRLLARMMSEVIHGATGIDIHPGATIGDHFYIDHGTGVVIGETTVIGNHVKIYQGVSLGALSVSKRLQDKKRHPTLEDHVTIYAGATILGGDTVVGHHSVVGGNVWLVKTVPPYSVVEHEVSVRVGSRDRAKTGGGSFDPTI
ncbi:MAG: serine O-acetyltransferase EpsC [Deltaproteobacteria bacterium]|nr:serine O-acetyltransferase EpsC [Deltaproteobacteria bacterium]